MRCRDLTQIRWIDIPRLVHAVLWLDRIGLLPFLWHVGIRVHVIREGLVEITTVLTLLKLILVELIDVLLEWVVELV